MNESAGYRDGFWGLLTAVCVAPAVLNYLTFVAGGSTRYRYIVLMARASATEVPMRYFRRKTIEQACRVHGWIFTS